MNIALFKSIAQALSTTGTLAMAVSYTIDFIIKIKMKGGK